MAKKITITISDHGSNCTGYYLVEYKETGAGSWASLKAYTETVVIPNVADAATYDVRITRVCCDGTASTPETDVIDTTSSTPQLAAPTGFTLTAGGSPQELDAAWTGSASATQYTCQISLTNTFTVIAHTIVTLDPTVTGTWSAAESGTTYHGRVRAEAVGFANSDWSNTDDAVAP